MRLDQNYDEIAALLDQDASADHSTARSRLPQVAVGQVTLLCGKDMTPEPVRWLWKDWLALGKLHILAGAPGEGKTTLATKIAATVTTGGV